MGRTKKIKYREPPPKNAKPIPIEIMAGFTMYCEEQALNGSFSLRGFQNEQNQPVIEETDENCDPLWEWHDKRKKTDNQTTYDIGELIDSVCQLSEGRHCLEVVGDNCILICYDDEDT